MGSTFARDMAESVKLDDVKLDVALEYNLRCNHYPPLPLSLIPACKQAIENANMGEWEERVQLPDGISWRGQTSAPTSECVCGWHLEWFLQSDDEDMEDEDS